MNHLKLKLTPLSVGIEHLDSFDITNIDASFAINSNGARGAKLDRLIPCKVPGVGPTGYQ